MDEMKRCPPCTGNCAQGDNCPARRDEVNFLKETIRESEDTGRGVVVAVIAALAFWFLAALTALSVKAWP